MTGWPLVLQFLYLAIFIGVAFIIKLNFKAFSKHLIPTCMIAGVLAFLCGREVLGTVTNWIFGTAIYVPFDQKTLFTSVTHLMSIGFISLALKDRKGGSNRNVLKSGFGIVNTYLWQAIFGFGITLLLAYTIYPDVSKIFGLLLPLSYAQGPGQATSIGTQWSENGVLPGGANIGAMIATIGFVWAIVAGIIMMNILVKKRNFKVKGDSQDVKSIDTDKATKHTSSIPKSAFIDDFTIQVILVATTYLVTYGIVEGLCYLLKDAGTFGATLAGLFRGFMFLFGTLVAVGIKAIFKGLRANGTMKINYVDNYLMQKISAVCFDFMITASIAALSFSALGSYGMPILILTTLGGLFTVFYTIFMCNFMFKDEVVENTLGFFGMWTGTVTTGVALLKEVDPDGNTSVTDNLVMGSGIAAPFGLPLMMILAIPVTGVLENKPGLFVLSFALFFVYSAIMMLLIHILNKRDEKDALKQK